MIKKVLTNKYFELLIYLVSFALILALISKRINMEGFKSSNSKIIKPNNNKIIYTIIPSSTEDNLYFASYFSTNKSKNKRDIDNMVYTRSLKSNNWTKMKNSKLNNNTLIIDLNYDNNKRLVAIGMSMKDNEPVYDIFIKENTNFESKWIKVDSNKKMRSICYDINSGNLIGVNSYDGQIYESKNSSGNFGYTSWIGPINYDKPMKKVMFNRDGILIGVGLIDNYIYKKTGKDWRHSEYDEKNINKTKVYDLFFDKDGCIIATTPNGVMKQLHQDFNSEFVDIRDYKEKHEDLMNNVEILKSRVGIEFIDEDFNTSSELGKDLKRIYEFKKVSKELCNNKIPLKKHSLDQSKIDILSRQNRDINDLYSIIDDISGKMNY
jgi:hypothetical protein